MASNILPNAKVSQELPSVYNIIAVIITKRPKRITLLLPIWSEILPKIGETKIKEKPNMANINATWKSVNPKLLIYGAKTGAIRTWANPKNADKLENMRNLLK